jgi:putative phage-type endonuclease
MIFVDPMPREKWLEWRKQGIGSSDAAAIMGASPWESAFELWARRTGRLAPREQTYPMRRGLRLEPEARREYEKRTGIRMPRQLGIHKTHSWLRGSFDGFNRDECRALEIKCPGIDDHTKACEGIIPAYYTWQCVHLMLVAELPEIVTDYFSYYPGSEKHSGSSALITVERDRKLEAQYFEEASRFWRCVEKDTPPNGNVIRMPVARGVFR